VSYVEDNLLNQEQILLRTHLHWVTFLTWGNLIVGPLTLFILPWFLRRSAEFAVTDRRVLIKVGVFSRRTVDLNLSKVESVDVDQGFWGRLLGYGTLVVVGTGGTRESFSHIADPFAFRRAVQQAGADLQGPSRSASLAPPVTEADHAARLAKAKVMLDQGLITPAEYDALRQRVLAEL
jgi:uncharacterized membrane protein YdbT with pleckstrin-like domain